MTRRCRVLSDQTKDRLWQQFSLEGNDDDDDEGDGDAGQAPAAGSLHRQQGAIRLHAKLELDEFFNLGQGGEDLINLGLISFTGALHQTVMVACTLLEECQRTGLPKELKLVFLEGVMAMASQGHLTGTVRGCRGTEKSKRKSVRGVQAAREKSEHLM
ncbi:hypothetical protein AK812_SmicGene15114 [Symbiodinium microadriaticum]|uniref:Uncharacterized protein n=1 Tax=Symbiodinium microadriaticum TaxID=2951 RepID=A0A1Q9E3S0_SYMMI|nr:hypothetical protein AK812_SmicGene15114 [Symbiodinium microadriaticum]